MSSGAIPPAGEPSSSEGGDDDAPILGLERFAALSADIDSGAARDEVIAREGLSMEAWTRAQESWLGKMADEASRKRFELTNRYNSAFVAQRRSEGGVRRSGKKRAPRVEPASVAAAPAPAPAMPSFLAAAPAFVAPPSFIASAPSYLEEPSPFAAPPPSYVEAPSPFAAPPPAYLEEPTPFAAPAPSFARALPFAPAPHVATSPVVAPSSAAIHAAPPAAALNHLAGTVAAEMVSPFASAAPLPFKQGRPAPPGPPPPPNKPPPHGLSGNTVASVTSPFAAVATPFEASADRRASLSSPPITTLAAIKPIPRPAFDPNAPMDLSGTVVASSGAPTDDAGKLPFRPASDAGARLPPPAPPPPPRAGHGLPFRATPPPLPPRAAPAAAPAPAPTPTATRFSLEQFASLSAEIAVTPAAVAQVRGRYGLDDASHRAEAEEWGRRFSADKELFARYGALFQSYRDWLARSPR
jgi:hypothetical protein